VLPPDTIPGPLHENVAPGVSDDPLNITVATEQVRVLSSPALASGTASFNVTAAASVAVHPFAVLVTVRV
jgi:hypothetical protein